VNAPNDPLGIPDLRPLAKVLLTPDELAALGWELVDVKQVQEPGTDEWH